MDFNGYPTLIIVFALTAGLVFRKLTKRSDSESIRRTDDASGEENQASTRDSESSSRVDHGFLSGYDTTDQMKSKGGSEAIWSVQTEPAYQYDVFLSFCGKDTRLSFVDNLYQKMRNVGIRVYLDSEELECGDKISELLKKVDESQIYIPIFSKNFASRSWCLRETARMVECHSKSNGKRDIIPIFYDVEPNDVKLITDLYNVEIRKHKCKEYRQTEEVEQWEKALKEVGSIMGVEVIGKRQGEVIESLVEVVLRKFSGEHVVLSEHFVEDHRQIKAIIEKLDVNSGGIRFLGIHGIAGIGKTTLAEVVFKKLSFHFKHACFLKDVPQDNCKNLQKILLLRLGERTLADEVQDITDGKHCIKRACHSERVLIVLDGVDKNDQIQNLAGNSDWFGAGSRIIITTKDKSILKTIIESSSEIATQILDYEVDEMEFDEALKLFCKCAFRRDSPLEDYVILSKKIVHKVAKLPLALELIGKFLYNVGPDQETDGDKRDIWEEKLKQLNEGLHEGVEAALMTSYKELDDRHKKVFLDIACFFTNEDKTYPVTMWNDYGYFPDTAIRVLCLRSLIKIRDNKFWMHDQIRDLGRHISHREDPQRISRVWNHEDVRLLKRKEINQDVEGLSLIPNGCSHNITLEELATLPNLKFLRVRSIDIIDDSKNNLLWKLRWLFWQMWQMVFRVNHFSNLVMLDLSDSDIKEGNGRWSQMKMNKLKVLNLKGCIWLKRTPNFSNFMSLEMLILAHCVQLTTIHSSIGKLKRLRTLNIEGCRLLRELPTEIGSLQSLTSITMPRNFHPFKLPETFGNLQSLLSLKLDEHLGISQLPNSIGGLSKLTLLSLRWCMGIKQLPHSIGQLVMLVKLDLSMSGIVDLPDSIGDLKNLEVIRVSFTAIRKFPHTIGQIKMLQELYANNCWKLTAKNMKEIEKLSLLKILGLSFNELSTFPIELRDFSRLQTLELSCHLPEVLDLPSSLRRLHMHAHHFPSTLDLSSLVSLAYLELHRLTASVEVPVPTLTRAMVKEQPSVLFPSSLQTLKFKGISLQPSSNVGKLSILCVIEFPMSHFSISENLIHLRELNISKCRRLKKIPGLSFLTNLQRLDLNQLESLVEIHDLSELESLLYLRISHCGQIERLPNLSNLEKLQHIELEACPKVRAIEGVCGLESLKLDTLGCTVLKKYPDIAGWTWLSRSVPKYRVFMSFNGRDTCYSFAVILCKELVHYEIPVFREDEELNSDDGNGGEHLLPLELSNIYVPLLSKNYASSWWCLRELAHMVKCTSESDGNKKILPIFYDVQSADVKLESRLYQSALDKHRRKFGDKVHDWEKALKKVAGIKAIELKDKSPGELIAEVLREVKGIHLDLPEHLVEDHPQIEAIIQKLDVHSDDVRLLVIHGIGGIGKTTLAKIVFNKLSSKFDSASFVDNIEDSRDGLVKLQKKLISSIAGSRFAAAIINIGDGVQWIKRVCSTRRVLIVLDDLHEKAQLQNLAGRTDWFKSGSRIIITTRNKDIMTQMKSSTQGFLNQPEDILDHEVHAMEFDQALQLFYRHAFGGDFPIQEDFVALSKLMVDRVGKLPLGIEVIGSQLYHASFGLKPHLDKMGLWKEILEKLEKRPIMEVRKALMRSYQELEHQEKEIFLDIACFFTNEDKSSPIIMWDDRHYYPNIAISVLLNHSLIKIGADNKFWMHGQIRDLGRYIALEEYPHKSSRVWIHEDAVKLLERKENNEDVEALSLTSDGHGRSITPEKFASLPNLRFLRVKDIGIFGNLDHHLLKQPISTGNNFLFGNLVMLDFSDSNIEDGWGGWSIMKMPKLKVLNLAGCKRLKGTPDFSNFMSLEMLILARCVNLTIYHSSIGKLKSLRTLNIGGCTLLGALPAEIGSLQYFQPFKIPETIGNLKSLSSFVLDDHPGIVQLPNSMGRLRNLTNLSLRWCVGIEKLPWSIGEMRSLVKLDISHSGIDELPDSIGELYELKVIEVSYTKIKKFPHTIGHLMRLEEFHAKQCEDLTGENLEKIGNLSHLKTLDFSYTHVVSSPWTLRCLSHLQTLKLGSSRLQEVSDLPSSVRRLHMQAHHFPPTLDLSSLVNLQYLELHRLTASVEESDPSWKNSLPEEQLIHPLPSGLSTLELRGISLPPPFSNLKKLVELFVIEYQLSSFSVPRDLIHLKKLKLSKCKSLVEIIGLSLLDTLQQIEIEECPQVRDIEVLKGLESLELDNHGCKLQRLMNGKRWTCLPRSAP